MTRKKLKQQIADFLWIYTDKLVPAFSDIDGEADRLLDLLVRAKTAMDREGDVDDKSIWEGAQDVAVHYWETLNFGRYTLIAS